LLLIGCAFFFGFGFLLVLVGANQAELARALAIDLSRTGLLISCLSLGLGLGVISGGRLAEYRARRLLFVGFCVLLGLSLACVQEHMSYQRAIVHILLAGVGAGSCMTFINTLASERYGLKAAKALALLHGSVTVGAILGPFAIHWLNAHTSWTVNFRLTGLLALCIGVYGLFAPMPSPPALSHRGSATSTRRPRFTPELLFLAVIGFCYVGIESSVITFSIPYASQVLGEPTLRAQTAISLYWVGILIARFGLLLLREHTNQLVIRASSVLGIAVMGFAILFHPQPIEVLTFMMGLALGSLYPVLIAHTGERFAVVRAPAIALISAAGSLGGFTIPFATGMIGDQQGIHSAALSLLFWILLLSFAAHCACRPQNLR